MKRLLQVKIELKGSCKGLTATQIERTECKAFYKRSDGFFECFLISATRLDIFKDGHWTKTDDTIERYPRDEKFGVTAWCGSEKSIRAKYYDMVSGKDANSDIGVEHFSRQSIES